MLELTINGKKVTVEDGATVLDAATCLAIEIPTLCHLKNCSPQTSCMLCVVKDIAEGPLVPACATKAVAGMRIDTECEEVQSARRDILNLLLSEHVGDCEAPCTRICPAHLDIPHMLREIERGNADEAAWIARRDLAIPRVLSHVCPAPCEKGCRRGQLDEVIPIRSLHGGFYPASALNRFEREQSSGRQVAVIGSGAAGLACAWQLRLRGFGVTVFDEASEAGGDLRVMESLPSEVLDAEIEALKSDGINFCLGKKVILDVIRSSFDGLIETAGEEHKLVVKAVANGKAAAHRLMQGSVSGPLSFDSRIGKLRDSELQELTKNCAVDRNDFNDAQRAAARCLHCDCRKPASCRLRRYAEQYGAEASEFPADERGQVQVIGQNGSVVFEPGKCIKCGLCIEVARSSGEQLGLAFIGRGFNMRVTVPFGENLDAGLQLSAKACVAICPTGALAFLDAEER